MRQYSKLRSLSTARKYKKHLESGAQFIEGKMIKEWTHWKLTENTFEYDHTCLCFSNETRLFTVNHVLWKKNSDVSGEEEFDSSVMPYLTEHYESLIYNLPKASSHPESHHVHCIITEKWSEEELNDNYI